MSHGNRPRVVFVAGDRVSASMGGVGIRSVELARAVRDELGAEVTVAATETDGADLGLPVVTYAPHSPGALGPALAGADAVVAQPGWPLLMRMLSRSGARLIFDLYDPQLFGTLEHFGGRGSWLRGLTADFTVDRLTQALRIGHHIICASERQRDLWLGSMLASGLLSAPLWDRDPTLRSVIDVVPYGVPSAPPHGGGVPLREQLGLASDTEIVLWNGGLWSWFDAPTAIRAAAVLRERRPGATLVFMGASPEGPAAEATREARELAASLGLLGTGVIFNEHWVPYEQRAEWLLGASCAISTHRDHLETRFSSRTRLLDCFWAGLPIVCTSGDEIAAQVAQDELGVVVAPGDPAATALAIERVLTHGRNAYRDRLAAAARERAWPSVAAPVLGWLRGAPPAAPPGAGRGAERRLGERLRTGCYLVGASTLAALRVAPPTIDRVRPPA